MDTKTMADTLEAQLRALGSPERAVSEKRYLKSNLDFVGASVPATRKAAVAFLATRPLDHEALVALVAELWSRGVYECRAVAVELMDLCQQALGPADLGLIETLIRDSHTWALVDNLAASIAGPLIERYPLLAGELDRWAADGDFWVRRSALLALLLPLRRGGGDFERFTRYADTMLEEKEFFIRKAIGWVLRDTARKRPEMVAAWLGPRAHRASGVTMTEATRRLSAEQREALMAAYREKRPLR